MINGLAPCEFTNPSGTPDPYPVGNYADGGGSVGTITDATTASSNCAPRAPGPHRRHHQRWSRWRHRLGITSDLSAVPSLPLGAADITPLEMASAYATLATDGVYNPPYFIDRITDPNGTVLYTHTPTPEQRVSPQTARLVTSILEQNVTAAPAPRPASAASRRPARRGPPGIHRRLVRRLHAVAGHRGVDGRPLARKFTINLGGQDHRRPYPGPDLGRLHERLAGGPSDRRVRAADAGAELRHARGAGWPDLTPLPPAGPAPPPEPPRPRRPATAGPRGDGPDSARRASGGDPLPTIPGFPG